MNESGKSHLLFNHLMFIVLLFLISIFPYADLFVPHVDSLRSLSVDLVIENIFVCYDGFAFFAFLYFFAYLLSLAYTLIVHLIYRISFLYKLRKPMRIYTGDTSLNS